MRTVGLKRSSFKRWLSKMNKVKGTDRLCVPARLSFYLVIKTSTITQCRSVLSDKCWLGVRNKCICVCLNTFPVSIFCVMTFASITVHTALTAPVEKRSRWTPTSSSWVSRRAGSNRLSLRCIQLKWDFRTTFVTKGCHTTPNKTPHVSAKAEEKSCPVKAFFILKLK